MADVIWSISSWTFNPQQDAWIIGITDTFIVDYRDIIAYFDASTTPDFSNIIWSTQIGLGIPNLGQFFQSKGLPDGSMSDPENDDLAIPRNGWLADVPLTLYLRFNFLKTDGIWYSSDVIAQTVIATTDEVKQAIAGSIPGPVFIGAAAVGYFMLFHGPRLR